VDDLDRRGVHPTFGEVTSPWREFLPIIDAP
jgi:hypothetical protein